MANIDEAGVKFVVIGLDSYLRDIKKADDATGNMGREIDDTTTKAGGKLDNFFKTAGAAAAGFAAAIAAAFVTDKVITFVSGSVAAASHLNEVLSKTTVVFGEGAEAVIDWSETTADSFGITQTAALEAAAGFKVIMDASGLTGKAADDMAIQMVELAGDMASFNDIPVDVALEKIRAGLVGEAEPLRQVGVLLSEAAVQEFAYANGIAKRGAKLTESQKVQARFGLIMEQTTKQQGDAERTAGSLANQQRRLDARMEELQATIGRALLPIMLKLTTAGLALTDWIATEGIPKIQKIAETIEQDWGPTIKEIVRFITNDLIPAVMSIVRTFQNIVGPGVKVVMQEVGRYIKNIVDIITGVVELIRALAEGRWGDAWEALKDIAIRLLDTLATYPRTLIRVFTETMGEELRAFGTTLAGWLETFVVGPFKALSGFAAAAIEKVGDFTGAIKDKLAGFLEPLKGFLDTYIIGPFKNIVGAAIAGADLVGDFLGAIKTSIEGGVDRMAGLAKQIGAAIFNGAKDGLGDLGGAIWTWVSGAINAAIGKIEGGINGIISTINRALEFSFGVSTPFGDFSIDIDPPDIPTISLPRLGGSGGAAATGAARGTAAAGMTGGGGASTDVLNRLVDVLGRIANVLPSVAQGAASPGGTSYVVTVNNAIPQMVPSLRADLQEIAMKGAA